MPECPSCLGEGEVDDRMLHAMLSEHCLIVIDGPGILPCPECRGAGEISEERHRELQAWAVARVDQFLAEQREKERSCTER